MGKYIAYATHAALHGVDEAAEAFNVSTRTIYRALRRANLEPRKGLASQRRAHLQLMLEQCQALHTALEDFDAEGFNGVTVAVLQNTRQQLLTTLNQLQKEVAL